MKEFNLIITPFRNTAYALVGSLGVAVFSLRDF